MLRFLALSTLYVLLLLIPPRRWPLKPMQTASR